MNLRKLVTLTFVAGAFCLNMTGTAGAVPLAMQDSSSFLRQYEFDKDPTVPGQIDLDGNSQPDIVAWQSPTLANAPSPTDNKIVQLNPSGSYSDAYFSDLWNPGTGIWQNSGISNATGYTVELSVKVGPPKDATMEASGSLTAVPLGATGGPWMPYAQSAVKWGLGGSAPILDTSDNTDDFHVFRVVREPGQDRHWVWRDGVLLNTTPLGNSGGNPGQLGFGGIGGTTLGSSDVDYIRFTPGAYAPLPSHEFHDSFNTVADPAGINDELGPPRQSGAITGSSGVGYVDLTGGLGTASITGDTLLFDHTSTSNGAKTVGLDHNFSNAAGWEYAIDVSFLFNTVSDVNGWNAIRVDAANVNEVVGANLEFLARRTGWWRVYQDGVEVAGENHGHPVLPAALDLNYDVEMLIDETGAASVYSVIVDGMTLVDREPFTPDPGGNRYIAMKNYGYGPADGYAFDNLTVRVMVPEPSTLVLLALGAVAIIPLRRRRK